MGQSLVIDILQNDEIIANVYYHWDGYTCSSFDRIADLRSMIYAEDRTIAYYLDEDFRSLTTNGKLPEPRKFNTLALKTIDDPIRRMIVGLQAVGGGFSRPTRDKHRNDILKEFPGLEISEHVRRNNGLIEIFPDGIGESDACGEEFAAIDLDSKTADDRVFFAYDNRHNMLEFQKLADGKPDGKHDRVMPPDEEIPVVTYNFEEIPLDKIEDFYKSLLEATDSVKDSDVGRIFRTSDGEYCTWIE